MFTYYQHLFIQTGNEEETVPKDKTNEEPPPRPVGPPQDLHPPSHPSEQLDSFQEPSLQSSTSSGPSTNFNSMSHKHMKSDGQDWSMSSHNTQGSSRSYPSNNSWSIESNQANGPPSQASHCQEGLRSIHESESGE